MKVTIKMNIPSDRTEQHFLMMVGLMLTFFFTQIFIEGIIALRWVSPDSMSQSLAMSHDAFLTFFGLAAGIFHGMVPQIAGRAPFLVPPQPAPEPEKLEPAA